MQQAKYQVHAFCNRCKGIHNMYVGTLRLDARSPKKETVADTFAGKELPPNIAALTNTKFICPNTKRFTLQKDSNQIFFVPFLETDQGTIGSKDRGNKKSNSLFRDFSHEYSSNDYPDAVKVQSHGSSKDHIDET